MQSIRLVFAIFTIFIMLGLFGCAATGSLYESTGALSSAESEIVAYRPDRFARGGNTFYLYLDGKEVARIQNAGYVVVPAASGRRELEIRSFAMDFAFKPLKLVVDTTPGNRTFVRFEPSLRGYVIVGPFATVIPVAYKFETVPEAEARNELKALRRSD